MKILSILTAKGLILTITIVMAIVSGFQNYREVKYIPLNISFNQSSLVISMSNGQYLVLRPQADAIDDSVSATYRPFENQNKIDNYSQGLDVLWLNKTDLQNITIGNNSRKVSVQREGANMVNLNYQIITDYNLNSNFSYLMQFDYSRESEVIYNNDSVELKDISCVLTIYKNRQYTLSDFGNKKSILIKQSYSKVLNFTVQLKIECN